MSAQSAKSRHPKTYDYSNPKLECDIIMKGGITSGVIYPWAVCELAKTYSFKCVGGTSAGAIAAAASAAAEYGRDTGGFTVLAGLPLALGTRDGKGQPKLLSLFQPQDSTRALFDTFTSGLGKTGPTRVVGYAASVVRWFWFQALLGALLGAAFIALSLNLGGLFGWLGALVGLALLAVGAVVGGAIGLGLRAGSVLPVNGFGMCRGFAEGEPGSEQLTTWLDGVIAKASGVSPLTFGMLWKGPEGTGDSEKKHIQLEMMTTDVTQGLPAQMPWEGPSFYFDPDELSAYFPGPIVEWMKAHPASLEGLDEEHSRRARLQRQQLPLLRPLPDAENLPVLVAARMSLSFPVLISAVPLYAIDWSLDANNAVRTAMDEWIENHPTDTDDEVLAAVQSRVVAAKHWFSDGGVCSNFPVHLFDAPLPSRPTFALNLRGFHPNNPNPTTESQKVYLPPNNSEGYWMWQNHITGEGWNGMGDFFKALLSTMQNWQDNSQLPLPGYRDRIVHVSLSGEEGGMNLDMDEDKIRPLADRGRLAAMQLVEKFAGEAPGEKPAWGWTNHRWTRYRVAFPELEAWLSAFAARFTAPGTLDTPGYVEAVKPGATPDTHGYKWPQTAQPAACKAVGDLVEFVEGWPEPHADLVKGAPKNGPMLRLVWRPGRKKK